MLPTELLQEIFSRLPAKSLLRFRCVSKSWRRIIDGPDLVKSHLKKSAESYRNHTLILTETGMNYHVLDLGPLDNPRKARVCKPPFTGGEIEDVSNPCNGIIVVSTETFGLLYLWNPFLKKHRAFPDSPSRCTRGHHFPEQLLGLGYDPINDDYKVIRNLECKHIAHHLVCSKTEVFTFRSKVWREVDPFPCSLSCTYQLWVGPVNGSLHMLCADSSHDCKIVGFGIEAEKYFEVLFPLKVPANTIMGLDLLGDCLCVSCFDESRVNIWVMKEYGVRDSWTILTSVDLHRCESPLVYFKPLVYSEDRKKVLLYSNVFEFVWYDLEMKTRRKIRVRAVPYLIQLVPCVKSLVFPGGSREEVKKDGWQVKENKVKKTRDDFLSKGFKLKL
ncbi:F-box protein CPR30 [Striga hermonthica]|uniref:F-box protein CPR30 n=1 Tax=Striga hermonthica TaxID=68872 RepID=A0A9N7RRY2_STRHE|nr:F-box protein CPR30 [Striga hermonthica]